MDLCDEIDAMMKELDDYREKFVLMHSIDIVSNLKLPVLTI